MNAHNVHGRRLGHRIAMAGAALALTLSVSTALGLPAPSLAEEAGAKTASIVVSQDYTADASGARKTFNYELVAQAPGSPMPEGSENGVYSFTMRDDAEATIEIPYELPLPGECSYTVRQAEEPAEGYAFDGAVYTLKLLEAADGEAVLVAYDDNGLKPAKVGWTVSFEAGPVPTPPDPDDPTPDPDEPSEPGKPGNPGETTPSRGTNPKTGDDAPIAPLAATAAAGVAAIAVAAVSRRRGGGRDE